MPTYRRSNSLWTRPGRRHCLLAIRAGAPGIAPGPAGIYRDKSFGIRPGEGLEPVQASYDAISGTAPARELAFSLPVQSRPTAAACKLRWPRPPGISPTPPGTPDGNPCRRTHQHILREFRPEESRARPPWHQRHLYTYLSVGTLGWSSSRLPRFPVEATRRLRPAGTRITTRRRLSQAPPEILLPASSRPSEQRAWLRHTYFPRFSERVSCPPLGLEVQTSTGRRRWRPRPVDPPGVPAHGWKSRALRRVTPEVTRDWVPCRACPAQQCPHNGSWESDWSLPPEPKISTANTARFPRRHPTRPLPAADFSPEAVSQSVATNSDARRQTDSRPSVRSDRTRHGDLSTHSPGAERDGLSTPSVAGELAGTNATLAALRNRPEDTPVRHARTTPAASSTRRPYYVGVMMVTLPGGASPIPPPVQRGGSDPRPEAVMRILPRSVGPPAARGPESSGKRPAPAIPMPRWEQNFRCSCAVRQAGLEWRRRDHG